MVTSAVLYSIGTSFMKHGIQQAKYFSPSFGIQSNSRFFFEIVHVCYFLILCNFYCRAVERVLVWVSFTVVLVAVNVSRLFIATHFPHQVVAGSLTGKYIIVQQVNRL